MDDTCTMSTDGVCVINQPRTSDARVSPVHFNGDAAAATVQLSHRRERQKKRLDRKLHTSDTVSAAHMLFHTD